MTVISLSIPESLLKILDEYIARYGYTSRSELVRDAIRDFVVREALPQVSEASTFVILVVTSKAIKEDADERVVQVIHLHSDVVKMLQHYKVDEDTCLNIIIARGVTSEIVEMSRRLRSVKGVVSVWVKDINIKHLL